MWPICCLRARPPASAKSPCARRSGRLLGDWFASCWPRACCWRFLGAGPGWVWLRQSFRSCVRSVPRLADTRLDTPVLLYSLLLSLVTGVLFGLLPALETAGRGSEGALKEGTRGVSEERRR